MNGMLGVVLLVVAAACAKDAPKATPDSAPREVTQPDAALPDANLPDAEPPDAAPLADPEGACKKPVDPANSLVKREYDRFAKNCDLKLETFKTRGSDKSRIDVVAFAASARSLDGEM